MRIAIVHDFLNQFGGAERAVHYISRVFPEAPIYTSIYFPENTYDFFKGKKIITTFMQKFPGIKSQYKKYFFIYPSAFRSMKLRDFDLIIASSSAFGSFAPNYGIPKICYCYTPPRFLWNSEKYLKGEKIQTGAVTLLMPLIKYLRSLDIRNSKTVGQYIAISEFIRERIKNIYHRDSTIIYPPIEIDSYSFSAVKEDYYLLVSRLKGYKRVDIAIEAFNNLKKQLLIAGSGEDEKYLKGISGQNITFLGRVSEQELLKLYSKAKALIFTGEEDFGLTPIEAQASGTPVIAYGRGGALETVIDGETGYLFNSQDGESLINTLKVFEKNKLDASRCRSNAEKFDFHYFRDNMIKTVKNFVQVGSS